MRREAENYFTRRAFSSIPAAASSLSAFNAPSVKPYTHTYAICLLNSVTLTIVSPSGSHEKKNKKEGEAGKEGNLCLTCRTASRVRAGEISFQGHNSEQRYCPILTCRSIAVAEDEEERNYLLRQEQNLMADGLCCCCKCCSRSRSSLLCSLFSHIHRHSFHHQRQAAVSFFSCCYLLSLS